MDNNKKPFMLLPSVESRIIAGILSFTGIMILLAWVAINENARMEEFKGRFQGRSIESGAILFENNCSTCHGQQGYGQAGVAPALNNPHFFSYDYFGEIDSEITLLQTRLENEDTPIEEQAEIESRIEDLEAERLALEEALLYDYASDLEAYQAQLSELDAEIVSRFSDYEYNYAGVNTPISSASLLGIAVGQLTTAQEMLLEEQAATTDEGELARIEEELAAIETDLNALQPLSSERDSLQARVSRYSAMMDAHAEVQAAREQIAELEAELAALPEAPEEGADPDAVEREAIQTELDELETRLDDAETRRDEARDILIAQGDIPAPFDPDRNEDGRLTELDWGGTLEDLIVTTLISGRPTSGSYWPQGMASWSQEAGGPLRRDQIQNLTDYILNYDKGTEWTIEDQRRVQQYAIIPAASGGASQSDFPVISDVVDEPGENVSDVIDELLALQEEPPTDAEGNPATVWDAAAGESAYASLGCAGCHQTNGAGAGPSPIGLVSRAEQYAAEEDTIESAEFYIVQSVLNPNAFLAPGYAGNVMPGNYADTIDIVTFSNIVAYLENQNQQVD